MAKTSGKLPCPKPTGKPKLNKKGISVIFLAIVQFSGLGVTQLSGSIGGTTWARNGSGQYARNKTVGVNPNTTPQSIVRTNFSMVAATWRTLTVAQRAAWIAAAPNFPYVNSLSQIYFLSGFGLYSKFNMNLANAGEALITAPSAPGTVDDFSLADVQYNGACGAGFYINYLPSPIPANHVAEVEMTRCMSKGKKFISRSSYKQVEVIASGIAACVNLDAQYLAVFGAPVANTRVHSRVSFINTVSGQRSAYVYSDTTI